MPMIKQYLRPEDWLEVKESTWVDPVLLEFMQKEIGQTSVEALEPRFLFLESYVTNVPVYEGSAAYKARRSALTFAYVRTQLQLKYAKRHYELFTKPRILAAIERRKQQLEFLAGRDEEAVKLELRDLIFKPFDNLKRFKSFTKSFIRAECDLGVASNIMFDSETAVDIYPGVQNQLDWMRARLPEAKIMAKLHTAKWQCSECGTHRLDLPSILVHIEAYGFKLGREYAIDYSGDYAEALTSKS